MNKFWVKAILLLLLIASCVAFSALSTAQTDRNDGVDADGRHYIAMAGDTTFQKPFGKVAPFCYRVATPWIASKMPPSNFVTKFRFLAAIDSVLMLLLMFAILQALGFSYFNSLFGMLLYAGVFWTLKFSFFSSVYIDHLTQVLGLLILWVTLKKWWMLLPILVFGAIFQKESVVALFPMVMLYFLHEKGWKWWPLYFTGFFLIAATVIPFLILRNNVHPVNASSPFNALEGNWEMWLKREGYFKIMLVATFSGLGLMPLVLLSRFRWLLHYLRHHPYWIAMLMMGTVMIFGGLDKARLMIYLLPAMTVLSVALFADLQQKMKPNSYWALAAITILLNFYLGGWALMGFANFDQYLDIFVPMYSSTNGEEGLIRARFAGGLFLLAVLVLRWKWWKKAQEAS